MLEPTRGERCAPSLLGDKYRLEREVGRGGMGVVYLATHIALQQPVAIKVVLPALAENPVVIQRVLREARCAAQITGDHVVRVIDVGQLDSGQPFIVMEYVEGQDLVRVLAERGPLPPPLAVHWLLEASVAIAEAHQKGIVHRDLKPGNLLLAHAADGRELIKVLDFGISKQLGISGDRPVTRANDVIGSPNYMAPEQIRTPLLVDVRADIWSLGAILLELLTGKRAFPGDTITAVYTRVLEGEPDLPDPDGEALPTDLRAIVLRCLRKDPNERFQSVHELVAALEPFASARSASALQAIARRHDRTLAERARPRTDASTESVGGTPPPSSRSRRALGIRPASRVRHAVVPGVLIGLMLSAAGAAWLGVPGRLLDRLVPSETQGSAPPSLVRSLHDAAVAPSSLTVAALAAAPTSPTAPTVTPIVASVDAGQPLTSALVEETRSPRGVSPDMEETPNAEQLGMDRGHEAVVLPVHSPDTPAPVDGHHARNALAATDEDDRASSRPSAEPRERPAPPPPPAAQRNPWDVSTFGGRS
jgi:serine/threonine protein kinase